MTNKIRLLTLGLSIVLFTGCGAVDDLINEYIDNEDGEEFSRTTLYLKDSNGTGVAGISYDCDDGSYYDDNIPLNTPGNTPSTGDFPVSYWPTYGAHCTITPIDAPALYLYDASGPLNNVQVSCTSSSYQFTGEDGNDGSINNAPSGTCYLTFDW